MLTLEGDGESMSKLGTAIWQARKARNLTQEQLAEQMGVAHSHIQHIESGNRKPSVPLLFQLAKRLDLSLDALIFEDRPEIPAIHTHGLTPEEIGALAHIADLMREKKRDQGAVKENV